MLVWKRLTALLFAHHKGSATLVFGLCSYKPFMEGNDVFICLPTGSGKLLCYSVLPYAFDDLLNREGSIVVVVSPLLALMKDHVSSSSMIIHFAFVHQLLRTGIDLICEGDVGSLYSWVGDPK